jgi:ankyrin repeat protein
MINSLDQQLITASENGRLDLVKKLIGKGVDIHAENEYALRLVSTSGHLGVVKYLVGKGADMPKEMDISEELQEIAIQNNVGNIKNISNLRIDLRERYRHLLTGSGFGLFENE